MAPASTTRAHLEYGAAVEQSPVGLFGLQRNTTETPSRSPSGGGVPRETILAPPGHPADRALPEARAAAAYSEKVGSSTSALPPVLAALAARNSASAPPLVGTTISALTPSRAGPRAAPYIPDRGSGPNPRRGPAGRPPGRLAARRGVYVLAEVEQLPDTDVEGPRHEVAMGTVTVARVLPSP